MLPLHGEYINDLVGSRHVVQIPAKAAKEILAPFYSAVSDHPQLKKDLERIEGNGFLNKGYVFFKRTYDRFVGVYKHDGVFWIVEVPQDSVVDSLNGPYNIGGVSLPE